MSRTFAAGALSAVVLAAPNVRALEVQTQVSTQRVGVGETFIVQLQAMSDGGSGTQVSDARLPLPPGMSATRPSVSPQSQVSIINGQMSQRSGVTLTWTVTAGKAGSFRVGPPSAVVAGERAQGNPIPVEVVTGGTGGGSPGMRQRLDPFDFLKQFGGGNLPFPPGFNFKSPFDDDSESEPQEQAPSYPEELRVDKAADPMAFLRATIAPDHVIVGQQVTLRVYSYGGRGQYQPLNPNEPSHADFLAFDASPDQLKAYLVPASGTNFIAAKLREVLLFPLHAGTLRAGNMKMGFNGRGYPSKGPGGLLRESNWASVVVTEPPLRGRPPGYKIGDVGEYTLTASVEPREIMAGEAVSVVATLSGTGSVPFKILTPEQPGVEWLEPTLGEKMDTANGVVKGSRTFSYVVKLADAGKLDLGEVTLPYYDLKKRDYVIARAALGTIQVKVNPNAKRETVEPKAEDRLAGLLKPRAALEGYPARATLLADRKGFWTALLLAPFGMVLMGGVVSAAGRARERLRARGSSLSAQLNNALREAREEAPRDVPRSVTAVERAVFLAIEEKIGLKARAVLKSELGASLVQRGLPSARAQALARILEDCDALRFVGVASGVDPVELAQRAATNAADMRRDKLSAPS